VIATIILGLHVWTDYISVLSIVASSQGMGIHADRMFNLKGLLTTISFPKTNHITLAMFFIGLSTMWILSRIVHQWNLMTALAVAGALFLSPHTNFQDGLLLTLPAVMLYNHKRNHLLGGFIIATSVLINLALFFHTRSLWLMPSLVDLTLIGFAIYYLRKSSITGVKTSKDLAEKPLPSRRRIPSDRS
jgi:hypothetical protein